MEPKVVRTNKPSASKQINAILELRILNPKPPENPNLHKSPRLWSHSVLGSDKLPADEEEPRSDFTLGGTASWGFRRQGYKTN